MRLEVGGGTLLTDGYTNVDPAHGIAPFDRRIQDGLPTLQANTVEEARASHVLEHIPAGAERIAAMNELHRVLMPGAIFHIIVPCVGYTDLPDLQHSPHHDVPGTGQPVYAGWQPWADPTHVSYWWFPESFLYFCGGPWRPNADYGIREWKMGDHWIKDGWEAHVDLIKP